MTYQDYSVPETLGEFYRQELERAGDILKENGLEIAGKPELDPELNTGYGGDKRDMLETWDNFYEEVGILTPHYSDSLEEALGRFQLKEHDEPFTVGKIRLKGEFGEYQDDVFLEYVLDGKEPRGSFRINLRSGDLDEHPTNNAIKNIEESLKENGYRVNHLTDSHSTDCNLANSPLN